MEICNSLQDLRSLATQRPSTDTILITTISLHIFPLCSLCFCHHPFIFHPLLPLSSLSKVRRSPWSYFALRSIRFLSISALKAQIFEIMKNGKMHEQVLSNLSVVNFILNRAVEFEVAHSVPEWLLGDYEK